MASSTQPHRSGSSRLLRWTLGIVVLVGVGGLIATLQGLDDRLRSWGMIGTRDAGHDFKANPDGSVGTMARGEQNQTSTSGNAFSERLAIGDRVRLRISPANFVSSPSAWVRGPDGDVLVVLNRDTRTGQERDAGLPSAGVNLGSASASIAVDAVLERVPYREAMYSWGLSGSELALLRDRGTYLRVTAVADEPEQP